MTETVLQSDDALVARDQVTLTDDNDDDDVMNANVCNDPTESDSRSCPPKANKVNIVDTKCRLSQQTQK